MSKFFDHARAVALLEQTLETFGGDPARWPPDARLTLEPFIAQDTGAQRQLAHAQSFDRLLDAAPQFTAERHAALADAIVARAARQPRVISQSAPAAVTRPSQHGRRTAMAGAALAASLIVGLMSGQNATVSSIAFQILNGDTQAVGGQQYALGDDADALLEEDLL